MSTSRRVVFAYKTRRHFIDRIEIFLNILQKLYGSVSVAVSAQLSEEGDHLVILDRLAEETHSVVLPL